MEWNVHQKEQGSAAMWDCIFRVGGAVGSDLGMWNCPWTNKFYNGPKGEECMASAMMLHVTPLSSIYMENMWFWVAGTLGEICSWLKLIKSPRS